MIFKLQRFVFLFFFVIVMTHLPLWASESEDFQIRLRWQAVPFATKYRIQISEDSSFQSLMQESETLTSEWTWDYKLDPQVPREVVFYRVASIDEAGEIGPYSSPQRIELPESEEPEEKVAEIPRRVEPKVNPKKELEIQAIPSHSNSSIRQLSWMTAIYGGFGSVFQSSEETNLKSVSLLAPFFQQKISLGVASLAPQRSWSIDMQLQYLQFRGISQPRTFDQPSVSTYLGKVDGSLWKDLGRDWQFGYGVALERAYRWVKAGSESVQPLGAFSLGPSISFLRSNSVSNSFILPYEAMSVFSFPVTGILTGGQIAFDMEINLKWNVKKQTHSQWILTFDGTGGYSRWATPSQTTLIFWNLWIALGFNYNSGS